MAVQSPDLNVMIKAAEKASRDLIRDFGEVEQLQVSQKGPGDFVSAADRRAEETIYDVLKHARPNFGFLMEESGEIPGKGQDDDKRFIIDPLDGTTNFLHGIPHWAISIALEVRGEVTVGVIYDPVKDEMFTAEKGGGAFMRRKRLRVSGRRDLMMSTIACGAPRRAVVKQDRFIQEYKAVLSAAPGIRRFGAAALDLAYVAAGRYEGFWERDLKAWDIAAGLLIVREAGGYAKDIDSESKNPIDTGDVLAANTDLYSELKKIIKNA
ncbi:MAG: inositol monophosphatase [Alphaproteobacteria bacterium]|nr:inositol monophosphatase [Alphaproteobacteria bacterium]